MIFLKSLQKHTILICLITSFLQAQDRGSEVVLDSSFTLYKIDSTTYHAYQKPTAWQHFPNSIYDVADYTKITFSKARNSFPSVNQYEATSGYQTRVAIRISSTSQLLILARGLITGR